MRVLICSDGTAAGENAARLGAMLGGALNAGATLLGIAEKSAEEAALHEALEQQAGWLREKNVSPQIEMRAGDPIGEIINETSKTKYDLVIIGARKTASNGFHRRSEKTYEVIKTISPPVLVAIGDCPQLKQFLVCTGGKAFIENAIQLTGKIASALGAAVTLLHVMAEPPAMYADLVQLEEDVDRLLESDSELGINLRAQKKELEKLGVPTQVRIRHGIVIDQVFGEVRQNSFDLIVTGSSRARGMLRHYIMGDLTRNILNHADCPVLVARAGPTVRPLGFWRSLRLAFAKTPSAPVA